MRVDALGDRSGDDGDRLDHRPHPVIGWIVYALFNARSARSELGSEIELAPNRKPYYDDEELEGRRLELVQFLGVLLLVVIVIGLPLYWVFEPSRQAARSRRGPTPARALGRAAVRTHRPTAAFNCAGCHGGMNATGGSAPSRSPTRSPARCGRSRGRPRR